MTSKIPDQVIKEMQEAYRFEYVGSDVDWRAAANVVARWTAGECAEIVEELTMQSGMCDGVTASKRIRKLAGDDNG